MKQIQKTRAQSGFTLIELVVVIVILGILAATALPKFASLQSDARSAAVMAAKGSVTSAVNMAHAKFLVAATTSGATATFEGSTATNAWGAGYPLNSEVAALAGLGSDYTTSLSSTNITIAFSGASSTVNCSFTYTQPSSSITLGVVAGTPSGC